MIKICVWTRDMTPKVTLARWTQSSGPLCLWQCFNMDLTPSPPFWTIFNKPAELVYWGIPKDIIKLIFIIQFWRELEKIYIVQFPVVQKWSWRTLTGSPLVRASTCKLAINGDNDADGGDYSGGDNAKNVLKQVLFFLSLWLSMMIILIMGLMLITST